MSSAQGSSAAAGTPPPGPPYAPPVWQFGGIPTIIPDVPICAIFLLCYLCGAVFHMTVFQINKKHGHFFVLSTMTFGFCMCRLTTFSLRLSWSFFPQNVRLGLATTIFVAAGTPILYIINLIFAHRIIRAQHPKLGWHRSISFLARFVVIAIVVALCLLIYAGIHQSFTLDPNIHRIDHDIQLAGTTFYCLIAFLPLPMILIGLVLPRRIRTEKFGQGRFRTKLVVLATSSTLLLIRALWGTTALWLPPVPRTEPSPWYFTKPAFYTVQLLTELLVVALYAFVRVDRRFYTPTGQRNSYLHLPLPQPQLSNDKIHSTSNIFPQDSAADLLPRVPQASHNKSYSFTSLAPSTRSSYVPLRVYTEDELFSDTATLADTLRLSRTSMVVDDSTGKWTVKLMSDDAESFDQGYEGYGHGHGYEGNGHGHGHGHGYGYGYGYGYGMPMENGTMTSEGSATGGRRHSGRISWVDLGRA